MEDEHPIKAAQSAISLLTDIVKAAGDHPSVKEAAGNLGQTAVTLTKTINNVLLPIAAVNFAFDKARAYFSSTFERDLAEKAAPIPPEHIVEPKASIAGPTLQGLAFTHEEPDLKSMYLALLATAMDDRVATDAHPAFVEIIKQLSAAEAKLLRYVLKKNISVPVAQIRAKSPDQSYSVVLRHLLNLRQAETRQATEDIRLPAMVDNWIRLGLVEVSYDKFLTAPGTPYDWVEQRPEFIRLCREHNNSEQKVEFQRGIMEQTELGFQFSRTVGLWS